MKNLKQWQLENDAEFDEKFPDIRISGQNSQPVFLPNAPRKMLKDFLHSSQESLKKVLVEEIKEGVKNLDIKNKEAKPADHEEEIDERAYSAAIRDILDFINNL